MKHTPRILIAGAHGFVGARAMLRYPGAIPIPGGLLRSPGEALRQFIGENPPDILLNAAAISDIGACEADPEGSYRANVLLPVELAKAAEEVGAKLICFSSDQVYTGCDGTAPYSEELTLPEPANCYARHKLEAERRVLKIHPDGILLRATWMYDMPLYGYANRGNFLVNTLDALLHGRPIRVPGQQHRGVTYVRQVVELLDGAFTLPGGVYNYGSENPLTMEQTARALLDALGTSEQVVDTGERRHDLWMDCGKLKKSGICFDTTEEGFARCVKDYGLG